MHDTHWIRYNSSSGAPSCALSDIARIILVDDWTEGSFMSTLPVGLLLLSLAWPSLPPAIPAQINMDLFVVPGLSDCCCNCVLHYFYVI